MCIGGSRETMGGRKEQARLRRVDQHRDTVPAGISQGERSDT